MITLHLSEISSLVFTTPRLLQDNSIPSSTSSPGLEVIHTISFSFSSLVLINGDRPSKFNRLFVFGDSYADTGNEGRLGGRGWKEPYGNTFPGKPSGRFSNGRIFTDFVAEFMGIPTPIPHKYRSVALKRQLNHGMNFAFGGTGVFDTELGGPNMTYQIDNLERLIKLGVFTFDDLQSSVAIISLAGNDYSTFMDAHPDTNDTEWYAFMDKVTKQLQVNMQRIHSLGVKRVAINTLPDLGCFPEVTYKTSYKECNESINDLAAMHGIYLDQVIDNANSAEKEHTYFVLTIGNAFDKILGVGNGMTPDPRFPNRLKPCCEAKPGALCGLVDANGEKLYSFCKDPASSFFWDSVHPTQEGWRAISNILRPDITNFLN